jgi:3-methyladenine DNA glycosylase AlkD
MTQNELISAVQQLWGRLFREHRLICHLTPTREVILDWIQEYSYPIVVDGLTAGIAGWVRKQERTREGFDGVLSRGDAIWLKNYVNATMRAKREESAVNNDGFEELTNAGKGAQ